MAEPEVTLQQLNDALGKAKVAELSLDKVYVIVFDLKHVNMVSVRGIIDQLVRMGIKLVAIFSSDMKAIEVYTLERKEPTP